MALTMTELRKLADARQLKYFVAPEGNRLMLAAKGPNGVFQILMMLEHEGAFLQFRTLDYLTCAADYDNLLPVLKVLGSANFWRRLVKYGWDQSDGEIVAYADIWVMDGTLTQQQFDRNLENFLTEIDIQYARLLKTMATGEDPDAQGSPTGMPDELMRKIEELLKRASQGKADDEDDDASDDKDEFGVI
jgi:hypothetical protein